MKFRFLNILKGKTPNSLGLKKNIFTECIALGLVLENTQCFWNIHTWSRHFMSP